MPRQDVPYGGAICRLKERIAEIWDKLDQKLHSINGVEGDGAGNVEIVSGDAAVLINNDQIGHRIEVALDSSKLPAAAVSSVNGQTGAVGLDAADIPSDGNSNVQADIAANKTAINDCIDSITSEQAARQNADSTLQTNINTVQASIPEMSTAPDPYKGVERDAQGRAFAADPATGATDKTLATANWVSQTGEGRPNNLIHDAGNENISGIKRQISGLLGQSYQLNIPSNGNYYIEIAYKGVTTQFAKIEVFDYINQIDSVMWDIFLVWNGGANNSRAYGRSLGDTSAPVPKFTIDNGILKLIYKAKSYHSYLINVTNARSWYYNQEVTVTTVNDPDYSALTLTDMVIQ